MPHRDCYKFFNEYNSVFLKKENYAWSGSSGKNKITREGGQYSTMEAAANACLKYDYEGFYKQSGGNTYWVGDPKKLTVKKDFYFDSGYVAYITPGKTVTDFYDNSTVFTNENKLIMIPNINSVKKPEPPKAHRLVTVIFFKKKKFMMKTIIFIKLGNGGKREDGHPINNQMESHI